jgi:hypothetical protein
VKAITWTRTITPVLTMADSKTVSPLQAAKGGSSSNPSKPEAVSGPDSGRLRDTLL